MMRLAFAPLIPIALQLAPAISPAPAPFHWHDDYTEYHLLKPRTGLPLKLDYKTGAELTTEGVQRRVSEAEHYIRACYGFVSSNVAADIATTADGRTMLSFENINGYASDVNIRLARRPASARSAAGGASGAASSNKALYEIGDDGIVNYRHERVYALNDSRTIELPSSQDVAAIEVTDMAT